MKTEILEKLPYWTYLTEKEKEIVSQTAAVLPFEKGALLGGGGSCLGMLTVLSGCIRVFLLSEDGREITLFRAEEGDSCVISASCVLSQMTFATSMMAQQDTRILLVPQSTFQLLTEENIHVKSFMYERLTQRFSQVMWVMQQILFLRFDQRLALYLLSTAEKTGSDTIRTTQEEIAREVNSAREVVARMLRRFADDGIVELKRGAVRLVKKQELQKMMDSRGEFLRK